MTSNHPNQTRLMAYLAASFTLETSQSLMILSLLPEASVRPSGENATDRTQSVSPVSVRSSTGAAGGTGAAKDFGITEGRGAGWAAGAGSAGAEGFVAAG